jgi:antitoxin Phd
MIRRQKRDVAVVLSVQEYERVCALNREEFQRFCGREGTRRKRSSRKRTDRKEIG